MNKIESIIITYKDGTKNELKASEYDFGTYRNVDLITRSSAYAIQKKDGSQVVLNDKNYSKLEIIYQ